jgi:hypothetical protein
MPYDSKKAAQVLARWEPSRDPTSRLVGDEEGGADVTVAHGQMRPHKDAAAEVLRVALEALTRVLGHLRG